MGKISVEPPLQAASVDDGFGGKKISTKARSSWRRVWAFIGPAYLVSVGYMDPGNWATDIAAGSKFGYQLLWVLLLSNIAAIFLQSLCVRLGIVYGRDLAQANRQTYPPLLNICLYALAEIAIIATDLAEVVGMAIGLELLTGLPIHYGVLVTVVDTFLLLYLQKLGMRKMEGFIVVMIVIIFGSFLMQNLLAPPDLLDLAQGFVPRIPDDYALYLAIGIIGATVMPHNLYLHSALVQSRQIERSPVGIRRAIRLNVWDSAIALNLAFFVNAGILVLAASSFHKSGMTEVSEIKDAHHLLAPLLGSSWPPILFAIALIAAGQSSTITGTISGQIVMEGYLRLRINPIARRLISRLLAVIPAYVMIALASDTMVDKMLIFSQVVLSLQLGFAIIPLVYFVSDKEKMKEFTIGIGKKIAAWAIIILILGLNFRMVQVEVHHLWQVYPAVWVKVLSVGCLSTLAVLLCAVLVYPYVRKIWLSPPRSDYIHRLPCIDNLHIQPKTTHYHTIAVALDFHGSGERVLSYALQLAGPHTRFVLIHIVESPTAQFLREQSGDYETLSDEKILQAYAQKIRVLGYEAHPVVGYPHRVRDIASIVAQYQADLLVVCAHRHGYRQKWIFGQTIDQVRKKICIPVFIVNE